MNIVTSTWTIVTNSILLSL